MTSFHERQKSLFNHLKNAEELYSFSKSNKVSTQQDYGVVDRKTYRKVKQEMRQFRGKESIFKKPDANIRECLRAKTVPDYIKNPQKWVYYTLSDVTPDQMSEKTNTETALSFIREMEQKQACSTDMEVEVNEEIDFKKPKFHLSSIVKKRINTNDEIVTVKNNKVIMPEYVVGVSKKKERKDKIVRRNSHSSPDDIAKKAELKLDHLYDNED